jgi:hypothetical protein
MAGTYILPDRLGRAFARSGPPGEVQKLGIGPAFVLVSQLPEIARVGKFRSALRSLEPFRDPL